mgnify:CR=1 FL=1
MEASSSMLEHKNSLTVDFFKQWVKEALCPSLKPNDIVIMDNLSCHKVKGLRELITSEI